MNRELLERLYTYRRNLEDQIDRAKAEKDFPVSSDGADVTIAKRDTVLDLRNQQLNMVNSLIDLFWKPIETEFK